MKRLAIIGLGLIGGSIGLALKKAEIERVGYVRNSAKGEQAIKRGVVDKVTTSLIAAIEGTDVVIIATPVMTIQGILSQISNYLNDECIVADTASTKEKVMEWAQAILPPTVSFIGGHPLAGKECYGIEAADAGLFQNCLYCLTPAANAGQKAIDTMVDLVKELGACPYFIDATEHDRLLAGVSHLPFILSTALVLTTAKSPWWDKMSKLAASGYYDLSRLASQSPQMNQDISLTNQANLLNWLDAYISELNQLRHFLAQDSQNLEKAFKEAEEARQKWLSERQNKPE